MTIPSPQPLADDQPRSEIVGQRLVQDEIEALALLCGERSSPVYLLHPASSAWLGRAGTFPGVIGVIEEDNENQVAVENSLVLRLKLDGLVRWAADGVSIVSPAGRDRLARARGNATLLAPDAPSDETPWIDGTAGRGQVIAKLLTAAPSSPADLFRGEPGRPWTLERRRLRDVEDGTRQAVSYETLAYVAEALALEMVHAGWLVPAVVEGHGGRFRVSRFVRRLVLHPERMAALGGDALRDLPSAVRDWTLEEVRRRWALQPDEQED